MDADETRTADLVDYFSRKPGPLSLGSYYSRADVSQARANLSAQGITLRENRCPSAGGWIELERV